MTLRVQQTRRGSAMSWPTWEVTLCWCGGPCDGLEVTAEVMEEGDKLHVYWPAGVWWATGGAQQACERDIRIAVRQHMREQEAAHDQA